MTSSQITYFFTSALKNDSISSGLKPHKLHCYTLFCKPEDHHSVSGLKPSTGRAVLLLKVEVETEAEVGVFFLHQLFAFLFGLHSSSPNSETQAMLLIM